MKFLINAGWSLLSWLTAILSVVAWPFLFVGDILNAPQKWMQRKMAQQDLEELRRAYGSMLVQLPERQVKTPEGETN